jgi:thioredoxin 1
MIQQLNEKNFDAKIAENDVVLVDFYADWCPPCRALHPILEKTDLGMSGKAVIAKVNIDENPSLASSFGVRSIPALFYIKKGKVVHQSTGLVQSSEIIGKLDQMVAAN